MKPVEKELSQTTALFMIFGVICLFSGVVNIISFASLNNGITGMLQEMIISDVADKYEASNLIIFESMLLLASSNLLIIIGLFDIITMQLLWKLKRITRATGITAIVLAVLFGSYRMWIFFTSPLKSELGFVLAVFIIAFNLMLLMSFSRLWKHLNR